VHEGTVGTCRCDAGAMAGSRRIAVVFKTN
jgi:hypothetical protein